MRIGLIGLGETGHYGPYRPGKNDTEVTGYSTNPPVSDGDLVAGDLSGAIRASRTAMGFRPTGTASNRRQDRIAPLARPPVIDD